MNDSDRAPRAVAIASLLGFAATMVLLHLMGDRLGTPPVGSVTDLTRWLADREPAVLALVLVRLLALALGYHLALTTLLAMAGRVFDAPRLLAFADAVTLPVFRSTAGRIAGLVISATTIAGSALPALQGDRSPAAALEAPPPVGGGGSSVQRVLLPPTHRSGPTGGSGEAGTATIQVAPEPSAAAVPVPAATAAPVLHRVRPGDHLWGVAEDALTVAWGRTPTDAEIVPFWRAVIAANPDVVDPDLIFPGQLLVVPPAPPAPV